MLEYTYEEALELLENNLNNARTKLVSSNDLFIRFSFATADVASFSPTSPGATRRGLGSPEVADGHGGGEYEPAGPARGRYSGGCCRRGKILCFLPFVATQVGCSRDETMCVCWRNRRRPRKLLARPDRSGGELDGCNKMRSTC